MYINIFYEDTGPKGYKLIRDVLPLVDLFIFCAYPKFYMYKMYVYVGVNIDGDWLAKPQSLFVKKNTKIIKNQT